MKASGAGLDLRGRRGKTGRVIYLDHNATSPLLPVAREAWLEAEDRFPGNPSSPHRMGARAETALEGARERLAGALGCAAADIVFTCGATEACNTVMEHVARTAAPDATVWISAVEHPAVAESARRRLGSRVNVIPVERSGGVAVDWVEERLRQERPALVTLMAANNETGVLQPWQAVRDRCAAQGVRFFCDATQWCGRLSGRGLGAADFVAGSAHKFGGPRGVGFLKCPAGETLVPLLCGGRQQDGRRAGTENVAGIVAMLAALEWCEAQIAGGGVAERLTRREQFERRLRDALPEMTINGRKVERLWNTVSVVMPETDCRHRWVVKLDKAGFAVSTGSACASGSERPSPVLTAMGLSAAEAGRALRFSAGWLTPAESWDRLLDGLVAVQREFAGVTARG